jgi:hypothetical protein
MHVKSHQDDDGPLENLSLETRMNVEADKLATEYLTEAHPKRPIALLFPSAKCQLIVNEKSVTRKIPQTLRFEAGSIGIRSYLTQHNLWTEATLDTVNWDAHGASHSFHRPHRNFLIKMCHRHLQFGHTWHRRNIKYPPGCPGCLTESDTQDHFLQCRAPSRLAWQVKLLSSLRNQLTKLNTATNLLELILTCIDCAIDDRPIPIQGPFHEALRSQELIGWLSMIRGYWSQEWQHAFERTYMSPAEETRKQKKQATASDATMANKDRPIYMERADTTVEDKERRTTWNRHRK